MPTLSRNSNFSSGHIKIDHRSRLACDTLWPNEPYNKNYKININTICHWKTHSPFLKKIHPQINEKLRQMQILLINGNFGKGGHGQGYFYDYGPKYILCMIYWNISYTARYFHRLFSNHNNVVPIYDLPRAMAKLIFLIARGLQQLQVLFFRAL